MLKVHSIETFGTHEGPGIRLVIFLQGCYFRCLYCHNPDTQALEGGTEMSVAEIVKLAEKERTYFGEDGGVTISGGEPTIQAKALIKLFKALRAKNIKTALDTTGAVLNEETKKLYDETDLVLLDTKQIDDKKHHILTGMSNRSTLALAKYRESTGKPMWLRYVLVPKYSDHKKDLINLGEHFKKYKHIERIEILPYHTLGVHKYEKLDRENPLEGISAPSARSIASTKKIFEKYFSRVEVR